MITIKDIRIYPIKSLDPIILKEAEIGIHSLKNDRKFAIIDNKRGKYINGKRTGDVYLLKTEFNLKENQVCFIRKDTESTETFELHESNRSLDDYLSNFFKKDVSLKENNEGKFMDVPVTSSLTILSNGSLVSLQKSFPKLSLDELRFRFRANIELDTSEKFWEEQLFVDKENGRNFKIGNVNAIGTGPRMRCIVPTRDLKTGVNDVTFVKKMIDSREKSLPTGSLIPTYGNLYHLAVDVYLPASEENKSIKTGDSISLGEEINLSSIY